MRHSFAVLTIAGLLGLFACRAEAQNKPLEIGMAKSFFTDQPKSIADLAEDEFRTVLKKATGLDGNLRNKLTAAEVAGKLDKGEHQFGIFFAPEFGWVQKKYPELQPLLVAINKKHDLRAYLVIHKNNPAKSMVDLQGKKIDMPEGTVEPTRIFLDKLSRDQTKKAPAEWFGSIEKSTAGIKALDEVARGNVQAAVVDSILLELYKDVKGPVYEKNLRVLHESVVFPPAVIAYKPGVVAPAVLQQFRDGLMKAHTIPEGRELMDRFKVDVFEAAPKDYPGQIAELLKTYPAP
jgi:ABC-type phosphate/phosphonate transport system substrate-binding protein